MSDTFLKVITVIALFIFLLAAGHFTGDLINRNTTPKEESVYTTPRPSLTPLPLDQIEFDPFDPQDAIDPNATPEAALEVILAPRKTYEGNGFTMQIPAAFESKGFMTNYPGLENVELFETEIQTSKGPQVYTMFVENGREVSDAEAFERNGYEIRDEIEIIRWNIEPSGVGKQMSTVVYKDRVTSVQSYINYYGTGCNNQTYTCFSYTAEFVRNGRLQRIQFIGSPDRGHRFVFESILETIVVK